MSLDEKEYEPEIGRLQKEVTRLLDREQQLHKELKKQCDKTSSARHARDRLKAQVNLIQNGDVGKLDPRIEELEGRPDHGTCNGVKLPAWMWCTEWERKVYVVGKFVCGSQYEEMSNGTLSGLPIDSLVPYTGQEKFESNYSHCGEKPLGVDNENQT